MGAQNQAALEYFIQLPVSRDMVCYLAKATSQVIRCDSPPQILAKPTNTITPPSTPPPGDALPSLEEYITSIIHRSHVQTPTLMTSLVYLSRLQQKLPAVAKGMACTLHRIFLAALILAAKNLNDSSPKNKHWARYTTVRGYPTFGFSITEVNLMEKQMLFLLDWDLRVRSEDLYLHLEPFLAPIRQQLLQQERIRQQQLLEQQQQAQAQAQAQRHYYSPYAIDTSVQHSSRPPSLSPSSRSSSVSSPDTASLDERIESPVDEHVAHNTYAQQDTETGEIIVHIQPREVPIKLPPINAPTLHRMRSYEDTSKPAKKARIGGAPGSFLARLLNGTPHRVATQVSA
jgi:G1/S-specific cyclin PLC1